MMTKYNTFLILASAIAQARAFAPSSSMNMRSNSRIVDARGLATAVHGASAVAGHDENEIKKSLFFVDFKDSADTSTETIRPKPAKKTPAMTKKGGAAHAEGLFSPVVKAAKVVVGDKTLNTIRAKAIGVHSDVIASFVSTSETLSGEAALETLFKISDQNKDGVIDDRELQDALNKLGFEWIGEKQAKKIIERAAGSNDTNAITFAQFKKEAPKTLRTNLTKLAKKNGGRLGFLV